MYVAIVGAGQVGVSAGLSALLNDAMSHVFYYDVNPDHLRQLNELAEAQDKAFAVDAFDDMQVFLHNVEIADLVLLATPQSEFSGLVEQIVPRMKRGAILADAASLREVADRDIGEAVAKTGRTDIYVLWCHPNKGNEGSGPASAQIGLYRNAVVFVPQTPNNANLYGTKAFAYDMLYTFWQAQGAQIVPIDAVTHDLFFSVTSHMEHFAIAFPLTLCGLNGDGHLTREYKNASTMLRNTTRVARGANLDTWLLVAERNRNRILEATAAFQAIVLEIEARAKKNEIRELRALIEPVRDFRDSLVDVDIRNKTARESVFGDINDFLDTQGKRPTPAGVFNAVVDGSAFASAVLRPYMIGVAAMSNATNLLAEKIDLTQIANSSFLDGSAPALNNPQYMAELLTAFHQSLPSVTARYLDTAKCIADLIAQGNRNELARHIRTANDVREQMPPPRRALQGRGTSSSEAVRKMYTIA